MEYLIECLRCGRLLRDAEEAKKHRCTSVDNGCTIKKEDMKRKLTNSELLSKYPSLFRKKPAEVNIDSSSLLRQLDVLRKAHRQQKSTVPWLTPSFDHYSTALPVQEQALKCR